MRIIVIALFSVLFLVVGCDQKPKEVKPVEIKPAETKPAEATTGKTNDAAKPMDTEKKKKEEEGGA